MKTTKTTAKRTLGLATALVLAAAIVPACPVRAQGVAERVGNGLDSAGRGIKHGIQNAFSKTQNAVHNQDIMSRVYSRIHWDKTLVGSTLELEVLDGGTAVVRGAVPDAAARQRAILLARDTVGVTQVVDQLTILPPVRVIPAAPPGTTTIIETTPTTTTIIKP